ncbi:MAG: CDP-glycerol glycerophosphotransferase family protein [Paludibacteraceae bacterium]|nr:CDP-glycerol glycerophosphotransferase family protein [Paludibacteraceae bacterium]
MDLKNKLKDLAMWYYYYTRNRDKKSVYFSAFHGQYSDSPRAIAEALHEIAPEIQQIWQSNNKSNMPDYVTRVFSNSECRKAMARANAWVMSGTYSWKANSILSVAVWHGDRGFKKVAYAAKESMGENYKGFKKRMYWANADIFTTGSDYGIMQAHEGFRYDGEIINEGLPRNDKLINLSQNCEYANSIREKLNLSKDTKVLLYAPTFRDKSKEKQAINVDLNKVISLLSKNGSKWICLVRSHAASKGLLLNEGIECLDVSDFGDMADLLLISDILITDYSSSAGDFILTERPCILVHFDRKIYEDSVRNLWFDPDESGFLIAKTQEELDKIVSNLYSFDHKVIAEKVNKFYGTRETGKSAMIVAQRIKDWVYRK